MAESTAGKQKHGFQPGKSGNPAGRPKGSRHRATMIAEALLDGQSEKLISKAIAMALSGDGLALKLCLERILPARKDKPVSFALAPISRPVDAAAAISELLSAVAAGSVTPAEASAVAALIETLTRIIEATDFERRLADLEAREWQV